MVIYSSFLILVFIFFRRINAFGGFVTSAALSFSPTPPPNFCLMSTERNYWRRLSVSECTAEECFVLTVRKNSSSTRSTFDIFTFTSTWPREHFDSSIINSRSHVVLSHHPLTGPMNFINNDPDHIEVLESKITSSINANNGTTTTTEVYSFKGKLIISFWLRDKFN